MKSVEHGLVWIENGREPQAGSSNVFAEHHVSLVRMCPGAFPQESLQAAPCEENTLHDLLANVVDMDSIPKRSVEVSGGFTPLDLLQGCVGAVMGLAQELGVNYNAAFSHVYAQTYRS